MGLFPSYFGGPGAPSPVAPGSTLPAFNPSLGLTQPGPVDFGRDVSVVPALDDTFAMTGGQRILAEALLRRITTEPGTLDFWPEYGFDVTSLLRDNIDQSSLFYARQGVINSIEQDERVDTCDCAINYFSDTATLQFTIAVVTSSGPFEMVLAVSDVAVKLLTYKEG